MQNYPNSCGPFHVSPWERYNDSGAETRSWTCCGMRDEDGIFQKGDNGRFVSADQDAKGCTYATHVAKRH